MIKRPRFAHIIMLLVAVSMLTPSLSAAETTDPGGVSSSGTTGTTTDTGATPPISLNPEQIQAMQDAANNQGDSKSVFQKASDFVTDNAPFFIIGIVVIAAIVAGILIVRNRPEQAAAATGLSAAERRRRKRAETQRAREEERLRRRARRSGASGIPLPPSGAHIDPDRVAIEAEKRGAVDQARAAGAVARAHGPVAAPYSPSQTAPAPGVITDPAQGSPAVAAPSVPAPLSPPAPLVPLPPGPETGNLPVPAPSEPLYEPALEAPGVDATVGRNAAAFAAAAGVGSIADRIPAAGRTDVPEPPRPDPAEPLSVVDEVAGTPGPVIDDRLRSTLDELRGSEHVPHAYPEPQPAARTYDERPEPPERDPAPLRREDTELSLGLASVERQLSAERVERDRTLREAEERLRRIEQQAEDAERRAAFAERLTQLKIEESERDKRLQDVISGIERAEQRADDAERRARSAERSAAAALEGRSSPEEDDRPAYLEDEDPEPLEQPVRNRPFPSPSAPRERVRPSEDQPAVEEAGKDEPDEAESGLVNLNRATFEELRKLGLSVTQATRILAYRERFGGYKSLEDLDRVPGFSPEKIESMHSRFTV